MLPRIAGATSVIAENRSKADNMEASAMECLECGERIARLENDHLLQCSGLTLHEYALRHQLPLDMLLAADQVNVPDSEGNYPRVRRHPSERARAVLQATRVAGILREEDGFAVVPGEIRRLDLLLWCLQYLEDYGFMFRQEYRFNTSTNRVVSFSRLKTLRSNLLGSAAASLSLAPPPDFRLMLAVCVALTGEMQEGYLFIHVGNEADAREIRTTLRRNEQIDVLILEATAGSEGAMLRCRTLDDSTRLTDYLRRHLEELPGVWERLHDDTPVVSVVKELVFDSAHFITDHPAKCSNQHGGRYTLQVRVRGRVDPETGCVIDYGYLKRVVTRHVVDLFDHHHLNYVAPELAWRSTTEMLCIYIWERLIDYLPGLEELRLFETQQSWCHYRGPTLAEFQQRGSEALLHYFTALDGRSSALRAGLGGAAKPALSVVA